MSDIPRFAPGDPLAKISADFLNAAGDAALAHRAATRRGPEAAAAAGIAATWGPRVRVKNVTGSPLSPGSVVGLSGVVFGPQYHPAEFTRSPVFRGNLPQEGDVLAVVRDACRENAIIEAHVAGMVIVQVEVTDTLHRRARIDPGNATHLASDHFGPGRIVFAENDFSETTQWCAVLLEGESPDLVRNVELAEDMAAGKAEFVWLDGASYLGEGDTGHDPLGVYTNAVEGQRGLVAWIEGRWQYIDLPCEAVTVD